MVGWLFDLLTLPVLGPAKLVGWLAETMAEEAEREPLDEERLRGELLDLQQRYDLGEIGEEEHQQREEALLQRLTALRESKAQRSS